MSLSTLIKSLEGEITAIEAVAADIANVVKDGRARLERVRDALKAGFDEAARGAEAVAERAKTILPGIGGEGPPAAASPVDPPPVAAEADSPPAPAVG